MEKTDVWLYGDHDVPYMVFVGRFVGDASIDEITRALERSLTKIYYPYGLIYPLGTESTINPDVLVVRSDKSAAIVKFIDHFVEFKNTDSIFDDIKSSLRDDLKAIDQVLRPLKRSTGLELAKWSIQFPERRG